MIYLLPILSGILWGSVGIFVRTLTDLGMDTFTIASSRLLLAAVIMAVIIFFYNKKLFRIRIKDIWIFFVGGVFGMLGVLLAYNEAVARVTLSLAAVLLSMSPIFVLLFAAVLFGEKITKKKVVCMLLAFTGCVLVSGMIESGSAMKWTPAGIAFGILAAVCYALYSLITKVSVKKGYHALTMTFYCMAIIAVLMIPATDWQCVGKVTVNGGVPMILFLILHALCASVCPYVFFTISLKYMEAGKASILAASEPVAAMVFGFFFFGEQPTLLAILGLVFTTTALFIFTQPES